MQDTTMISIELSVVPAHPTSDETNVSRRECASGTQQRNHSSSDVSFLYSLTLCFHQIFIHLTSALLYSYTVPSPVYLHVLIMPEIGGEKCEIKVLLND